MSESKWGIWRSNEGACDACTANNGKIILIADFKPLHPNCKCKCIPINSESLLEYLFQDIIGYEALAAMPNTQMIEFSALIMLEILFEQGLLSQTEKQILTSIITSQKQRDVLPSFQNTDILFLHKDNITPLLNAATDYLNGTIGEDDFISIKERIFDEIMPAIIGVSSEFWVLIEETDELYDLSQSADISIENIKKDTEELLREINEKKQEKAHIENYFDFDINTLISLAGNSILAFFSQGKDAESVASALIDFDDLVNIDAFTDAISLWYDIKVLEAGVDENLETMADLEEYQAMAKRRIDYLRSQMQNKYPDELSRYQAYTASKPAYFSEQED